MENIQIEHTSVESEPIVQNKTVSEDEEAVVVPAPSIDTLGQRGFIVHDDTGAHTNEGLGSHARGMLFPFLQISLETDLIPLFNNNSVSVSSFAIQVLR